MKFELTEIVAVPNPDEVLRVLEQHLRAVAGDVVRSDGQVTAFGIGPSPRTVNRRDTTVIEGSAVDGTTVLRVNVTYQASALLGNMPQDDIVRSKIEGAIDETRGELRVWKAGAPPPGLHSVVAETPAATAEVELPQTLQQPRAFDAHTTRWQVVAKEEPGAPLPEESVLPAESVIDRAPAVVPQPELAPGSDVSAAEADVEAAGRDDAPAQDAGGVEQQPAERPIIRLSKTGRRRAKRQTAAQGNTEETLETNQRYSDSNVPTTNDAQLRRLLRGQSSQDTEDAEVSGGTRWKTVLAVAVLLIVTTVGTGYAFRDALPIPEPWKGLTASWSAKLVAEVSNLKTMILAEKSPEPTPQVIADPVVPPADDSNAPTVSDPEVMVRPETNIYLWVQDWAAAMRSKDPVAQASYYAETVDRYLDETAVSHDRLIKAKKDAIAQRSELWTMKVEHVYVENQSATGMSVRAVKRILSRSESGAMAVQKMRVRLKALRVDGTWKIVEEQELGPPVPPA